MRKFCVLFLSLLVSVYAFADTQIQMEEYNGVYRIPCSLNGAKMKLIFDTGASNVCLSLSMAEYLYDNEFISSEDIIGSGSSSVADGRIVDHVIINIRDIDIAGHHLKNVQAVVIDGQSAPLLMGQTAIQKIGSITLNGSILTIHNDSNEDVELTPEQIDKMFEEARTLYTRRSFYAARDLYKKLYDYHQLSDYGIVRLADCYSNCSEHDTAIEYINKVVDIDKLIADSCDFYNRRGMYYYFSGNYNLAISDFERAELYGVYDWKESFIYYLWGYALKNLKRYSQAIDKLNKAFEFKAAELGVDTDFLSRDCRYKLDKIEESVKDDMSDSIVFDMIECGYLKGDYTKKDFVEIAAEFAYKGNQAAKSYCEYSGIDYVNLYLRSRY